MFIVIDGLDKLGKSTQASMLYNYLESKGHQIRFYKQPDNLSDTLKSKIKDIINNPDLDLCPITEWGLHLASHANQWHYSIAPSLRDGYTVIMDRSWISTWAYQGIGKEVPVNLILAAEAFIRKPYEPDKVFIFYSALRNPYKLERDSTSMEQQLRDEDYRENVSEAFASIARIEGYTLIDVEKYYNNAEGLHEFIKGLIEL